MNSGGQGCNNKCCSKITFTPKTIEHVYVNKVTIVVFCRRINITTFICFCVLELESIYPWKTEASRFFFLYPVSWEEVVYILIQQISEHLLACRH
jgi:hypothetical protein